MSVSRHALFILCHLCGFRDCCFSRVVGGRLVEADRLQKAVASLSASCCGLGCVLGFCFLPETLCSHNHSSLVEVCWLSLAHHSSHFWVLISESCV